MMESIRKVLHPIQLSTGVLVWSLLAVAQAFPVPYISPAAPDPVVLGTSISLTCSSYSMGPFNLTWSVNGSVVASAVEVNDSLTFTVDFVSTDNYTSYTCTSQNTFGMNSTSVTLKQAVPPVVRIVGFPFVTVTINDSFSLQVTISQYNLQPVTVQWERNGSPLSNSMKFQLASSTSQLEVGSAELTALFTESLMDNGTYTVAVSNAAGSRSVDFEVEILISPGATIMNFQKPTVTVSEGDSAVVVCTATGVPAPTISWFLHGVLLADGNSTCTETPDAATFSVTSNLSLTSVMRESAFATITCNASNGVGANSSDSTQLIVQFVPMAMAISANQTITSPDPVSFNCTVDSYPSSAIIWHHSGVEVQVVPLRVTISTVQVDNRTQESTLTLLNTTAEDIGTYTCSAMNSVGLTNRTTELQVLVAPKAAILDSQKPTVTFSEGDSGALTCTATGVPAPNISWFQDGALLSADGVKRIITTTTNDATFSVTSTLNVTSVMRESAFATITCNASNGVGANSSESTQFIVQFPPIVTNISANQTITSPDPVSFNCNVDSYPTSTITWLHNGDEVQLQAAPPRVTISTVQVDNRTQESTLTLLNTTAEGIGTYTCSAMNFEGLTNVTTELQVLVIPKVEITPETVVRVVNETNSANFTSVSTGIPEPYITWFVDPSMFGGVGGDSMMIPIDSDGITFSITSTTRVLGSQDIEVTSTLTVYNTTRNDSGIYTCVATNSLKSTMDIARLIVQFPPDVVNISLNQVAISPNPVRIFCITAGYPRPTIMWFFNGEPVTARNVTIDTIVSPLENTTLGLGLVTGVLRLNVTQLSDAGVYECVSSNLLGIAIDSTNLTVYSQPFIQSSPVALTVNQSQMATLNCTAHGNPVPTISWTGPSANFTTENPPGASFTVSSVLTIDSAVRELHEGLYTCSASNGIILPAASNATLTVQVPPTVEAVQERFVGLELMNVTLAFIILDASPEVQTQNIRWTFTDVNGIDFNIPTDLIIANFSNLTGVFSSDRLNLTFMNLKAKSGGIYVVTATNEAGGDSASLVLVFKGPATIVTPPQGQQVVKGNDVTFDCFALAEPLHSLTWHFINVNGISKTIGSVSGMEEMITEGAKYQITDFTSPSDYGRLLVRDVQFEDRGTYVCLAENRHGSDTASATLAVQVTSVVQLYLRLLSDCLTWVESSSEAKLADISTALSVPLQQDCNCSLSVQRHIFSCLGTEGPQIVVFLAELSYVAIPGADDLSTLLASWLTATPHIMVVSAQLRVDTGCLVATNSLNPEACPVAPPTIQPTDATATAVSVFIVVLLVLVIIAVVTAITVILRRRKQFNDSPDNSLSDPGHGECEPTHKLSRGMALASMVDVPFPVAKELERVTSFSSRPGTQQQKDMTKKPPFPIAKELERVTSFSSRPGTQQQKDMTKKPPFPIAKELERVTSFSSRPGTQQQKDKEEALTGYSVVHVSPHGREANQAGLEGTTEEVYDYVNQ